MLKALSERQTLPVSDLVVTSRSPFVLAAGLLLFLQGCSLLHPIDKIGEDSQSRLEHLLLKEQLSNVEESEATVPKQASATYNFLLGEFAFKNENFSEAQSLFEVALKYDESDGISIHQRLLDLYLLAGNLDKSLDIVKVLLAEVNDEQKPELLLTQSQLLSALDKKKDAQVVLEPLLEVLAQTEPTSKNQSAKSEGELAQDLPVDISLEQRQLRILEANRGLASFLLSGLYAEDNKSLLARQILESFVSAHPKSVLGHYYLALVCERLGDMICAENKLQTALSLRPGVEFMLIDQARLCVLQEKPEKATAIVGQVLAFNPKSVAARRMLLALRDIGFLSTREVLASNPDVFANQFGWAKVTMDLALLEIEQQQMLRAERNLHILKIFNPNDWQVAYYLASVYAAQGKTKTSIEKLKQIPSQSEYFEESRALAAYLLQTQERYEEAVALLEEVRKEKEDGNEELLALIVNLQRQAGDIDAAVKTLRKLIKVQPNNPRSYFLLAVLCDELDRRDEVITSLERSIEIDPNYAEALNYLGYTYAEGGEKLERALELINRALSQDPENGYFIDSLGWAYFRMGRYDDALREMLRAVGKTPNDAVILEHLGMTYMKLGDEANALLYLDKALANAPESEDEKVEERIKEALKQMEKK